MCFVSHMHFLSPMQFVKFRMSMGVSVTYPLDLNAVKCEKKVNVLFCYYYKMSHRVSHRFYTVFHNQNENVKPTCIVKTVSQEFS